jgi:arylsulfatase A-like enzyme
LATFSRRYFLGAAAAGFRRSRAADGKRPNILFFFPDQHRFDWTCLNRELDVRMPNLAAVAKSGIVFSNALVASPLCAPSRACLASGKEYDRCGVRDNGQDYPVQQTTFYSLLREAGYHVAGCGKLDLHKASPTWGLDGKHLLPEWGFSDGVDNAGKMDAISSGSDRPQDPYMAFLEREGLRQLHVADFRQRAGRQYAMTGPTPLPDRAYCDNWIAENGLKLLRNSPRNRPWFLMVNFAGPHPPVDITASMERACRDRAFPQPNQSTEFDSQTHVAIRQNYSAMIENIDRWLGAYLEEIHKRGERENTLVVYSSDHGEMLGDHNRWGKTLPYHPSVSVPLVVAGPGVAAQGVSGALVSHIDLAGTFLESAGCRAPREMESRSLWPVLSGTARHHREFVRSGLGKWRLVYDGAHKLIAGFDPRARNNQKVAAAGNAPDLLFDLKSDPLENADEAQSRQHVVERLRKLLV